MNSMGKQQLVSLMAAVLYSGTAGSREPSMRTEAYERAVNEALALYDMVAKSLLTEA